MASQITVLKSIKEDLISQASLAVQSAENDAQRKAGFEQYDKAYLERCAELKTASEAIDKANEEKKKELEALEAEIASVQNEINSSSSGSSGSSAPCNSYCQFIMDRGALFAELSNVKNILNGYATGHNYKVHGKWIGRDLIDSDSEKLEAHYLELVRKLRQEAEGVTIPGADTSLDKVILLVNDIVQMVPSARKANALEVSKEGINISEVRAEIGVERQRLLTWCRQQKSNLDALPDPYHIQEFCASILVNFPLMDKNFIALLEMSSPILPDEQLMKELLECNEVWLNLQVSTYEKLRHALFEIHPRSKLEDEVRDFSNFPLKVNYFLDNFYALVTGPSDTESAQYITPAIQKCESVKAGFSRFVSLPKQLQEFAQRMSMLREAYSNLRRTVLSHLTFLPSPVPPLGASMKRKEEYIARMKDLKKWIDLKSNGETWKQIHQRILAIRDFIQNEQNELNEAKEAMENVNEEVSPLETPPLQ